jgi:cobalt-zinc-cadmium resistance protein CzcA
MNTKYFWLLCSIWRTENLPSAKARLMVAMPLVFLILILLYFAFGSIKEKLCGVFSSTTFCSGRVLFFYERIAFSISAGVGFIALFGDFSNGIVLIEHFKELKHQGMKRVLLNSY